MNETKQYHQNPAGSSTRILGYDFARALAVLGMILVNFKVVMCGWVTEPAWLAKFVNLFQGKAAATFVVLAGVGLSLLSAKARRNNDKTLLKINRNMLLQRSLILLIGGFLYTPIWPADILHFYGIYIAIAAFLLAVPSKRIILLAVGTVGISILLLILFKYETGWNFLTLTYLDLWSWAGMFRHLFFNGFHPVFPWLALMLYGMWLGRLDLQDVVIRKRVLIRSLFVMLTVEFLPRLLLAWPGIEWLGISNNSGELYAGTSPMPPFPLFIISGCATASAVICLSVRVTEKYAHSRLLKPLVHTGQMALTLYVAHVIVGMGVAEEIAPLHHFSLSFTVLYALGFSIFSIVSAHLIRKRFKRGPLEWLMRQFS